MTVWWVVFGLVVVCLVMRAVGPAVLGGRELPAPMRRVVTVLAPALLWVPRNYSPSLGAGSRLAGVKISGTTSSA